MNPDSTTFVLLPGLDGTAGMFGPFLEALADKGISPDRCFALPLPASTSQEYQSLAEHVSHSLPEGNIVLLAESFSTPLAMMLAESHKHRTRGMILVAGFCQSPLPAAIGLLPLHLLLLLSPPVTMVEYFLTGDTPPLGCLDAIMKTLRGADSRVLASRLRSVLDLRESNCPAAPRDLPVLLIQSKQDRLIRRKAQSQLERHFPDARVVRIDGPHLLLQTKAHACASAVVSFLGEL